MLFCRYASSYISSAYISLNILFYRFFLFVLFLVAGFRDTIGCDWQNYEHIFNYQASIALAAMALKGEVGFYALTNTIKYFNLSYIHLNVACAFIFFYGFNVLAKRQKDPLTFLALAFPILIIGLPMSGIRQGAAVGILCIALICFIDKKVLKFIALVILATSFHTSAIVFLALTPFIKNSFSLKTIFIGTILLSPILLLESVANIFSIYSARYMDSEMDSTGAIFRLGIMVLTSLYFFVFLKTRWKRYYPEDYQLILMGAIATLLCFCFLALSTTAADRLGYYLIPFQLIILARIQFFPSKYRRLATIFPFLLIMSTFFIWAEFSSFFNSCYSPYAIKFF